MIERFLKAGEGSQYRHTWEAGDFVVWDNRQLLHSATPNDKFAAEGLRLLHRVRMAAKERPEGPKH